MTKDRFTIVIYKSEINSRITYSISKMIKNKEYHICWTDGNIEMMKKYKSPIIIETIIYDKIN